MLVSFHCAVHRADLLSFPTRRSSDLIGLVSDAPALVSVPRQVVVPAGATRLDFPITTQPVGMRSEEHTSELQSLTNLVCRLLLEKNNDQHYTDYSRHQTLNHVLRARP